MKEGLTGERGGRSGHWLVCCLCVSLTVLGAKGGAGECMLMLMRGVSHDGALWREGNMCLGGIWGVWNDISMDGGCDVFVCVHQLVCLLHSVKDTLNILHRGISCRYQQVSN